MRVFYEKDLPILTSFKSSENSKLRNGPNYSFLPDFAYFNDVTPNDSRNVNVIAKLVDVKLSEAQYFKLAPANGQLFNFAKNQLIFSIFKLENLDIASYVELRRQRIDQT